MNSDDLERKTFQCPNCKSDVAGVVQATLDAQTIEVLTIAPPNGNVTAKELGKTLIAFASALECTARQIGGKVVVLITDIQRDDKGQITTKLLVCDAPKKQRKRKK